MLTLIGTDGVYQIFIEHQPHTSCCVIWLDLGFSIQAIILAPTNLKSKKQKNHYNPPYLIWRHKGLFIGLFIPT